MPEPLGETQDSPPPPPRRRWQFSLATLLIVVTIAAVVARFAARPEPRNVFRARLTAAVEERLGEVIWGDDTGPHIVSFKYSALADSRTPLGDDDLRRLRHDFARLGPFSLNLLHCGTTDAGIAELARLRRLECLCLADTQVTDAVVEHLANMQGLQFVDVTGTVLTMDGIARLQACRPELAVWWSGDRDRSIAAVAKWLPTNFSLDYFPRSLYLDDHRGRLIATLGKYGLDFPKFLTPDGNGVSVLPLPSGDAIAFGYHDHSDSGVDLARLAMTERRAKIAWTARSEPLNVDHSKYFHNVTLRLHGEKLVVHSAGSYGTFVELRDLETGALLKRWRY